MTSFMAAPISIAFTATRSLVPGRNLETTNCSARVATILFSAASVPERFLAGMTWTNCTAARMLTLWMAARDALRRVRQ